MRFTFIFSCIKLLLLTSFVEASEGNIIVEPSLYLCQDSNARFEISDVDGKKSCDWAVRKDTDERCLKNEVKQMSM